VHVTVDPTELLGRLDRPAARHLRTMVPDSRHFTLAEWSRQISIIDSIVRGPQRASEGREHFEAGHGEGLRQFLAQAAGGAGWA